MSSTTSQAMIICRRNLGNPHVDCTTLAFRNFTAQGSPAPITAFPARINVPILGG
jgi:hypothetical protein